MGTNWPGDIALRGLRQAPRTSLAVAALPADFDFMSLILIFDLLEQAHHFMIFRDAAADTRVKSYDLFQEHVLWRLRSMRSRACADGAGPPLPTCSCLMTDQRAPARAALFGGLA